MYKRKTWREKLYDNKDFPRIEKLTGKMSKQWGDGTIVIPRPIEVDELMRKVLKGKLTTINNIRETLAGKHGATIACPICTGIFARTAAGAAEDDANEGKEKDNTVLADA